MIFFKRRPAVVIFIYFATGIVLAYYLSFKLILCLMPILVLLLIMIFQFETKITIIIIIFFIFGTLYMSYDISKNNNKKCVSHWLGKKVIVNGVIKENIKSLTGNKIFIKPNFINGEKIKYGKIQLDKRFLPKKLEEGDIIEVELELNSPAKKINPGGFSYYNYLRQQKIYSIGYLTGNIKNTGERNNLSRSIIIKMKKRMINLISRKLDYPYNSVIAALLLGERTNLPEKWEENFSLAGANHLLAISGLHVGFIMLILLKIAEYIKKMPVLLSNIIITLILVFYVMLTGIRASVFRAGMLSIFFLWGRYYKYDTDIFNIMAITAILNTILNPYSIFQVGFQLTYIVLIMILLWQPILKNFSTNSISISAAAQLGSFPITAYYFNIVTPVGIITNLWAIPLIGVVILLSFVGLIFGLFIPDIFFLIGQIVVLMLKLIEIGMKFMVCFPFGNFEVASPVFYNVLIYYLMLIYLPFLFKGRAIPVLNKKFQLKKKIFIFIIILLVLINCFPSTSKNLRIIFFAVGQGDSILLELPDGKNIIVDGGGYAGENGDKGEYVILPYLQSAGIKKLDLAIITHFDTDHALGVTTLVEENRVAALMLPHNHSENYLAKRICELARKNNIPIYIAKRGDIFKCNNVIFKVLHPYSGNEYSIKNRNNNSLVLKVNYYNFSLMLTGDLEKEGEVKLVKENDDLTSDILKLGHHGSGGSSSDIFLKKVNPDEAIISVGENNYGHPAEEILKRLKKYNIRKWITEKIGAIIIKTDGNNYNIKGYCPNKMSG